mgnify:CR=1 FL=1
MEDPKAIIKSIQNEIDKAEADFAEAKADLQKLQDNLFLLKIEANQIINDLKEFYGPTICKS